MLRLRGEIMPRYQEMERATNEFAANGATARHMTVRDMAWRYLVDHGYEGLANGSCGCCIHDLMPCDEDCAQCAPAVSRRCDKCEEMYLRAVDAKSVNGYFYCPECGG